MIFGNFFKKKAEENAQLVLPTRIMIRRGMWVMRGKDIGILADFNPTNGAVEIHFCDPVEGTTVAKEMIFDLMLLRQAKLSEIPEKRRPTPERAAKFGYFD
jgi:hypothetical protein